MFLKSGWTVKVCANECGPSHCGPRHSAKPSTLWARCFAHLPPGKPQHGKQRTPKKAKLPTAPHPVPMSPLAKWLFISPEKVGALSLSSSVPNLGSHWRDDLSTQSTVLFTMVARKPSLLALRKCAHVKASATGAPLDVCGTLSFQPAASWLWFFLLLRPKTGMMPGDWMQCGVEQG